jgi:hypothetical protein
MGGDEGKGSRRETAGREGRREGATKARRCFYFPVLLFFFVLGRK